MCGRATELLKAKWRCIPAMRVIKYREPPIVPVVLMASGLVQLQRVCQLVWSFLICTAIWQRPRQAKKCLQNARIQVTLRMRKISSGPLLSTDTFCSIKYFSNGQEGPWSDTFSNGVVHMITKLWSKLLSIQKVKQWHWNYWNNGENDISVPFPLAQGGLLWPANIRRPSCVVRRQQLF